MTSHSRRRMVRGTTLIELALVLSLMGVLLSSMIGLGTLIRTSQQRSATDHFHRQEIRRFAGDLRRSVRDADDVSVQDDGLVLVDFNSDTKMTYQVEPDGTVSWTTRSPGDSIASRDTYRLGRKPECKIESIDEERILRWTLTESDRPQNPIVIEAMWRNVQ